MGEVVRMEGRQHGQLADALDWVIRHRDPVTVVTATERMGEWWRDRLAGTDNAVIVVDPKSDRPIRPVKGRDIFFDMFDPAGDE